MKIELAKEQYKDLIISVVIGNYIREAVDEQNGKDFRTVSAVQDYLLSLAKDFDAEDMIQNFEGHIMISDNVIEEYHDKYIEEFEEESFWSTLTRLLGQRDYEKYATKAERDEVASRDGWFGDVIDKYYEKYENEFETRGIERLVIEETSTK
jgi:hypothetical protein